MPNPHTKARKKAVVQAVPLTAPQDAAAPIAPPETVPDNEAHPLFPPQDGVEGAPAVDLINVTRWDPNKSAFIWANRSFGAEELTDLESLYSLYGGGRYTLVARFHGRVTARQLYELDGPPRPMNGTQPQQQALAGGPAPAAHHDPLAAWAPLLAIAVPLVTALINRPAIDPGIVALITGLSQNKGDSGNGLQLAQAMMNVHDKGIERGTSLAAAVASAGQDEPDGTEGIVEGIAKQALEHGMANFMNGAGGSGGGGVPPAPGGGA